MEIEIGFIRLYCHVGLLNYVDMCCCQHVGADYSSNGRWDAVVEVQVVVVPRQRKIPQ